MARRHLNGDGRRARIGIVVPSVNTVMEPWAHKVVPDGVSIFAARMFIPPATTPEAFIEMDRNEGKAAIRQLSSVFPDAIAYGCTASSIVQGLAYDAHLRAEIEQDYGTPSTTAAHAILTQPSREFTGRFCIDEEVLRAGGMTDFTHYRDAAVPEEDLLPDFFI